MTENQNTRPTKRSYPPLYEKLIPIFLALLAVVIVGILILTIGVAFGVIGG